MTADGLHSGPRPGARRWWTIFQRYVAMCRAQRWRRRNIQIHPTVRFGRGARCSAAAGATVVIGRGVEIAPQSSIQALGSGARVIVGDDVFIGPWCIIAAAEEIDIGAGCMIAEMVSIRDHDHDPAYPPRAGRTLQSPVRVGERVWIGAKSTLVRGASIGADAVVGAHAVVNRAIPAGALAVGVPAQVKRTRLRADGSAPSASIHADR
jgi:acetyltransferase-like isoleucine patch superfamily enzyme